jgi:RND family efflux transporter MFP subunit
MKSFSRVTAPFDGVVTARDVDIGTLITSGNKELFRVAKIDPLRIFVNVPQTYVEHIHNGQSAELRVQERPGRVFPVKVTGFSNSLDTSSRSMLVILLTPNPGATLYPGMYAQVRFSSVGTKPALRVPGDAIILGKSGASVATVGSDQTVHFKSITIGQDLGSEVEVTSGLSEGELVISNPSDSVQENVAVEVKNRN